MIGRKLLAPAAVLLLMACGPANTDAPSATMSPGHSPVASAASPSATATPSSTPKAPEPNTVAAGDDALVGDVLLLPASLVLIGSIGGSPAIWTSTVGETWQMQAEEALGATGHLADVIEHDGLVLAVGWRSERVGGAIADEPLVVAGGNGDAWRVLGGLPLPPDVRAQLHGIATDGRRVVIGGLLSDGSLAAWVTTDSGVTWAGPNVFPTEPGSSIAAMTFADNEFLAVGESIGQQSGPGVWRSRDGLEWSADDLLARGGSLADVTATARGAVAVGHDGEGHATVWSLSQKPPARVEPPAVADLYAIAPAGDSIVVAPPHASSTSVLLFAQSGWAPIRLAGAATVTLRALSAANGRFVVAGDDGSGVKVWLGTFDQP